MHRAAGEREHLRTFITVGQALVVAHARGSRSGSGGSFRVIK